MPKYQQLPLVIGVALTMMLGLFYTSSSAVLRSSIQQAESHNMRRTVEGVLNVMAQNEEDFSNRFSDWSSSDDTYTFVQNGNRAYQTSNLVPQVLSNLKVDVVAFVRTSGQIVYATSFNQALRTPAPLPLEVKQHLQVKDPLLQRSLAGQNVVGILLLPRGPMLITARPILPSSGKGTIRGSLIFGRYLGNAEVQRFAKVTRLKLNLIRLNETRLTPEIQTARDILLTGRQSVWLNPLNDQAIAGYTLLQDLYAKPALLLQAHAPREIYRQGRLSLHYLLMSLGLLALIFGCLVALLVYRLSQFLQERQRMEATLQHEALHDPLTGLPNRTLFMQRLVEALEVRAQHPHHLFAVLFLDLDRFKLINDSMGHLVGDQLLIKIAERLRQCLRSSDTCARLGGDEFAILLEGIDEFMLHQVVERIQQQVSLPIDLQGQDLHITTSIGTILSSVGYDRPDDFLRSADMAMYRAKALGKARHERFNQALHDHTVGRLKIELDLRHAIEQRQLQLYYQPIICLATGIIDGFEALVRWHHPEQGIISPANFIPIAEETGLIIPLGDWILEEACYQLKTWLEQFPDYANLSMSINISAKQFSHAHLVQKVQELTSSLSLNRDCLHLEITESTMMENAEVSSLMLKQLSHLGVKISVDDFGTGYSSLAYLTRFPIQRLKIDRSFIQGVECDPEKLEIVRAIGTLGWNLGMEIVAEGIETAKQLAQVKNLHCEYGQGYFLAKPLNRETATLCLSRNSLNQAS